MAEAKTKVYVNGKFIGFHPAPDKLMKELLNSRRQGFLTPGINFSYNKETDEISINTDAGRVQRPLIVVENGKPKLTEEHIEKVKKGLMHWEDLIKEGIIEYLDAEEEENALVAEKEEDLTPQHTHLEINPVGTLSIITGMIPFLSHNLSGKVLHGAKMFKQAVGFGQANFKFRTDTEGFLLHYPQKEIVKTKIMDFLRVSERPQAQNFVVAIMPYYGFNMLDAVVINKGAIDRCLGRSSYFRVYESTQTRYPGGQRDKFEVPSEEIVGYQGAEAYKSLGEDGLAEVESYVDEKQVLIGKTSPPRFLEEIAEFGVVKERRREASVSTRKNMGGYVDSVFLTEGPQGDIVAKVKTRSERIPEVGDKFASRHGQKGVVGAIIPEEDMPFNTDGIRPDLILNPHSIPSRMTIGHLLEMLAGKAACLKGEIIDGTAFNDIEQEDIEKILIENGLSPSGMETFYDGISGERIEGRIFTGVITYRRLYHLVAHKMQARSRGPVQILTRQPTEGKEKEGGLRFGEMEGETLIGHGASMLLQEKIVEDSDKSIEFVCEKCGIVAVNDRIRNKKYCPICKNSKVYAVEMSYAFKLMLDELKALGIYPKLNLVNKA